MSRELKFRLWNSVWKRMNYDCGMGVIGNKLIQDNQNVLMQSIGIKDKTKKEIYEGDILRYCYHVNKPDEKPSYFDGIVEYNDKIIEIGYEHDETRFVGFILRCCPDSEDEYFTTIPNLKDIEIIGNIYENPKLFVIQKEEVSSGK